MRECRAAAVVASLRLSASEFTRKRAASSRVGPNDVVNGKVHAQALQREAAVLF